MVEIREYCERTNLDKPDIFEMCKKKEIINKTARSIDELDQKDANMYMREVRFYFEGYKRVWKDIV